jgi:4a-hydroxytetrahydrobiopterin dehydratase
MSSLSEKEIQDRLSCLSGWAHEGNALRRKFQFASFMPGIRFVYKIAEAAEEAQHHPDIAINYNVVSISLSTHSEGGVTAKDFSLAQQIDALADASD